MARRVSSPRFIGRDSELLALEDVLTQAGCGGGSALIAGDAGIGKSRLIAEISTRASDAGAVVLIGECVQLAEGERPFAPIISALRPLIEEPWLIQGFEPSLLTALSALWPGVCGSASPVAGREQLFEAVYRALARLAARQLVVLIVEDVHWIDPSSRDLLGFLVQNARRDRLAVVATYRTDELRRGDPLRLFFAELERSGRAQRLELGPLEPEDVAQQITEITGARPEPSALAAIYARCEGNPFFAEELIAGADPVRGALPGSLREALMLRVERLTSSTQSMLRAAAAVGRSIDHRLLAHVVAISDAELLAVTREAIEHHVLVATDDGAGYRFRHALLREAIYADTLPGERLALHRAIAETLNAHPLYAGHGAAAAAELAHHWQAAGELPAALAALVRASSEAERMHAYPEALRHLRHGLELWAAVPDPQRAAGADRVQLLIHASEMAEHAGDAELAVELGLQSRDEVDARADPVRAAAAEARAGGAFWNAGRADEALEHLAQVVRLVPAEPPSVERAQGLAAFGRVLMLSGSFARSRGYLEEALALARLLGARIVESSVLNSLAIVYDQFGERERASAAGRAGLGIATELGDGSEMLRAYINGSQAIDNDGHVKEALAMGLEGIDAAHRLGLDRAAGDQLRQQAAWRLIRLGRLDEAERVIGPAAADATLLFNIAATKNVAGYLAAARGEFDVAERLLAEAWELMQDSGGFQLIGLALAWTISLHLWQGQLERARRFAAEWVPRAAAAEGQLIYTAEVHWLAARVEADVAQRDRALGRENAATEAAAAARAACAGLDAAIARHPGDGAPPEAIAFAALAHAEFRRSVGAPAAEHWDAARERFAVLGERYPMAYADLRAAEALAVAGGSGAEITERVRRAYTAATNAGVRPFLDEVVSFARRARVALEPPDQEESSLARHFGLTEREAEVLALLAEGLTNRQIGEELFITDKTASAHVSRILMKLGVANRAGAAAVAHRVGLARQRIS